MYIGEKLALQSTIIYDRVYSIANLGTYEGAVVVKFSNTVPGLLFGDKIIFKKDPNTNTYSMNLSGLRVFFDKTNTHSKVIDATINHQQILEEIDYAVLIGNDIVDQYDVNRYTTSTEDMIRFKKTQGLYYDMDDGRIDHRYFIAGEIINRAVAILKNSGVVIADQLGITEYSLEPIFYDSILIQRENQKLEVKYEHWFRVNIIEYRMIGILGNENF